MDAIVLEHWQYGKVQRHYNYIGGEISDQRCKFVHTNNSVVGNNFAIAVSLVSIFPVAEFDFGALRQLYSPAFHVTWLGLTPKMDLTSYGLPQLYK